MFGMQNTSFSSLGYIHSTLDRRAGLRSHGPSLQARAQRFIVLAGDRACVKAGKLQYFQLDELVFVGPARVFLGVEPDGTALFAAEALAAGEDWPDLRSLAAQDLISPHELGILAQARGLLSWHARHGFCGNCGTGTESADFGLKRQCLTCGAEHFPRTDPVVILTVTHGQRILLGRGLHFPEGLYSALAGFMEPGESIEQAARRELLEETGIEAGHLQYVASQPWPFPSSLMIGLIGVANNDEIIIDPNELADARWFSVAEVKAMLNGENSAYLAPKPYAIAHHLLRAALESLE